jgi:hypothetical protein
MTWTGATASTLLVGLVAAVAFVATSSENRHVAFGHSPLTRRLLTRIRILTTTLTAVLECQSGAWSAARFSACRRLDRSGTPLEVCPWR